MRVCVCKVSNTKTRPPSCCTRNRPRCLELGGRLSFWLWYTSGGKRLQGMNVEDLGIDIFTDPVGDVRKRLQRLMNLAEDEVLKMLKYGFGDVRAPRLWYDKAARDLCQIGFARHLLDRCVFMSFNGGDLPKSVDEGMERLDGILVLHVDDFIGGGEGVSRVAVEGLNQVPVGVPNFASSIKWLRTNLELGSLHLGLSFPFTGIQLTQSPNFECIQLSLENYL